MQEFKDVSRTVWQNFQFFSTSIYPLLFGMCAAFFLCNKRKKNVNYVYLSIVILLFFLNPFFANNCITFQCENSDYYMVLCTIPVVVLTAYAVTEMLDDIEKKRRAGSCVALFLILQAGIGFSYTSECIGVGIFSLKINPEVMQIADALHENNIDAKTLAPDEVASQLREYSLATKVYYGNGYVYDASDMEDLLKTARKNNCNIIVLHKEDDDPVQLEKKKYYPLMETEHYYVYVNL